MSVLTDPTDRAQSTKFQGPKPVFRRADIRRISGGYPADIRRISGGYPAEIRRISALRRSPPDGFSVTSRAHLSPHWLEQGGEWRRAGAGTTRPAVATLPPVPTNGERDARALIRDVTENPSGGLLRSPDIRRISALRKTGFGGSACRVTAQGLSHQWPTISF